jgi:acyl dehydratase
VRLDTCDAAGDEGVNDLVRVALPRVTVEGEDRALRRRAGGAGPIGPTSVPRLAREIPLAATAAHVYTELRAIWNPIHKRRGRRRERQACPAFILHGTATLALAVGVVVRRDPRWRSRAR